MSAVVVAHPAPAIAAQRKRLEAAIAAAIAALDNLDGDPDFEDTGDDEPSLSASLPQTSYGGSQIHWLQGRDDDREEEADAEPSLCGLTFGTGNARDLEAQCDDEGASSDFEASLCGVTFGYPKEFLGFNGQRLDSEATERAFVLDQREMETAR